MTVKERNSLHEKIIAGVKAAIAQLYEDARKNDWELVISEDGKIKKIRPARMGK